MSSQSIRRAQMLTGHLVPNGVASQQSETLHGLIASADFTGQPLYRNPAEEKKDFEAIFDTILQDVLRDLPSYNLPPHAQEWIKRLLTTVVPGGKLNRGLTVLHSYILLSEDKNVTKTQAFQAQILGWCVELLQAFFLVADDVMDQSVTRRGVPCWYRQPHPRGQNSTETVGLIAINDAFILEGLIYKIIKKYFRQEKYYADILDLFTEVSFQTEIGQLLDLTSNLPGGRVDLNLFTEDNYKMIVKYKTAYYSFYLPVALAMVISGITSKPAFEVAEDILLPMGEYFQAQDDYLDCYGDPATIGKIGRDIEENKCSWLIVQCLKRCTPEQKKLLEQHYGRDNASDVAIVKRIFKELNLEKVFKDYEEESYQKMIVMIRNVRSLPQEVFTDLLGKIYKRKLKTKRHTDEQAIQL
ncbi:farnesyl diphosphate synthase [Planoprotostelium fungivorum]|uniref:Farnesyl diphosphate synthase n=1 Tax=Planoprotostelium fungivorum TaxID=1890364 RepID=A0A2P6N6Q0_9EUKA|nr:farnesyl diphosphate synthase [Planoprotostelium fungivorum]